MTRNFRRTGIALTVIGLMTSCSVPLARGYSVLAHEAVVDTAWPTSIQPLLLARFPGLSPEQLKEAHAYAYGGCIIQDMGYYPFGSHLFSDLVHYVRTGDFVMELLAESQNPDEYAFGLGALAHYAADTEGHPLATNRAVPLLYPNLRAKFGNNVTYEDDPKIHIMVEFSFDVIQVAGGGYLPESYHDFIGFQVSKDLLGRAFEKTYGIKLSDLFLNEDLAIGTYRRAAGKIIPQMTKLAWKKQRADVLKVSPHVTRKQFIYRISRRDYVKEYGTQYERPGLLARFMVALMSVLPRVGGARDLSFKPPTPQVERMFLDSLIVTRDQYRTYLEEAGAGGLDLPDRDFDTGRPTEPGEYSLADQTYGDLVDKLKSSGFKNTSPQLRYNILTYYLHYKPPYDTPKQQADWNKTVAELYELKNAALEAPQAVSANGSGGSGPP
jgi:hypothetical protein